MNALDLLHKIRTCDRRGKFTHDDTVVLNDLIELIQHAEAGARQVAIEQALRIVRESRCPWLHAGPEQREGWGGARDEIYNAIESL
jgi:predicted RNA-binding protein associated with RNAse of E/G family